MEIKVIQRYLIKFLINWKAGAIPRRTLVLAYREVLHFFNFLVKIGFKQAVLNNTIFFKFAFGKFFYDLGAYLA
jgi:hypothetical protein